MKKVSKWLLIGLPFSGILYFGLVMPMLVRFKVNNMNLPDGCRQVKTIVSTIHMR